ncbi:kinase-like domain-containing protein [Rhizophagus clarus]|uniref:Kinase-like domain-containing protein n=1 Tax=Rhizophagus clarus TaxID=94130 RepID=A0A8H3KUK5_9GLOM|nr:kinase-like domain-containing protein [Rhizophagus clarus]
MQRENTCLGVVPYVDPKFLDNKTQQYKLNTKSDVYSVLLWQISSGCNYGPFYEEDAKLIMDIRKDREKVIEDNSPN